MYVFEEFRDREEVGLEVRGGRVSEWEAVPSRKELASGCPHSYASKVQSGERRRYSLRKDSHGSNKEEATRNEETVDMENRFKAKIQVKHQIGKKKNNRNISDDRAETVSGMWLLRFPSHA